MLQLFNFLSLLTLILNPNTALGYPVRWSHISAYRDFYRTQGPTSPRTPHVRHSDSSLVGDCVSACELKLRRGQLCEISSPNAAALGFKDRESTQGPYPTFLILLSFTLGIEAFMFTKVRQDRKRAESLQSPLSHTHIRFLSNISVLYVSRW